MGRSALGRSVLFVVLVASTALTGLSSFGGTSECRASPGPPAPQGTHWYYRVDRTNNRHCWYLQPAGMQVRSHEIIPLSKPRPQIVAEQSLAPTQQSDLQAWPSQPATAEGVLIEPIESPIGARSAAHFATRWPDMPASVDLGDDSVPPQSDYVAEHESPHTEELISTRFVSADAISQSPHKSTNAVKFGSVFIAGAISVILFQTLLKLARVLSSSLTRPRLKNELNDGSEINLSKLMWALRRVDENLNATEPRRYSPLKAHELVTDERAPKRDHRDRRADSALPRLVRR